MFRKRKKSIAVLLSVVLLLSSVSFSAFAATSKYETESNNTLATANVANDDYDCYGKISSTSDVDYWSFSYSTAGMVNIYLGSIPSGCNYNLFVCDSNGTTVAYSTKGSNAYELVRCRVVAGKKYYAKVISASGTSTSYYKLRVKRYDLVKGRIFTADMPYMNTREDAARVLPSLWKSGYDAEEYIDNLASTAYSVLTTSGVYVVSNHGEAGSVRFAGLSDNSFLYAKAPTSMNRSSSALSNLSSTSLSKLNLIIFSSCNSGNTHTTYGNLVDTALNKGAVCAIGWKVSIPIDESTDWLDEFFRCCNLGYSVRKSMEEASAIVKEQNRNSVMGQFYYGSSLINATVI